MGRDVTGTADHNKKEASEELEEETTMKSTNNESGVSNGIRAKIEALRTKLSVDATPSLKPSPDANASGSIKISTPKSHSSNEISGGLGNIKTSTRKAHSSEDVSGTLGSIKTSTPKAHSLQEVSGSPGSIKISTPKADVLQEDSSDQISSGRSNAGEVEIDNSTNSPTSKKKDLHRAVAAKTSQSQSPRMPRESSQYDTEDKHHDDEDSRSFTSSRDTSTRSANRFKPTVPVGPKFVCGDRVARRKEYYKQLEEKQKAMEAERLAEQARIKEEEEAALRKLRRSMTYRANPVPSFYREGPPPKTKLKKLPLTRPKSPNLTRGRIGRDGRKSCEGVTTTAPNKKDRFGTKTGSKNKVGVRQEKDKTNTPSSEEQINSNKDVVGRQQTSPTA